MWWSELFQSYDPEYMRKIHQLMMRLEDQDNQIIDLKEINNSYNKSFNSFEKLQ